MMSGMTMSSMSQIRNPQRPPSSSLLDTLLIKISTENFQGIFLRVKNIIHNIKNDHVLHVSRSGILNILQAPPFLTPLPDTLRIKISTQHFQGFFITVKNIINDVQNDPVLLGSNQEP